MADELYDPIDKFTCGPDEVEFVRHELNDEEIHDIRRRIASGENEDEVVTEVAIDLLSTEEEQE